MHKNFVKGAWKPFYLFLYLWVAWPAMEMHENERTFVVNRNSHRVNVYGFHTKLITYALLSSMTVCQFWIDLISLLLTTQLWNNTSRAETSPISSRISQQTNAYFHFYAMHRVFNRIKTNESLQFYRLKFISSWRFYYTTGFSTRGHDSMLRSTLIFFALYKVSLRFVDASYARTSHNCYQGTRSYQLYLNVSLNKGVLPPD